jgi:hypothetical protein
MREFHFVSVKAEKKRITGSRIWGVDSDERAGLKEATRCRFGQRV